jgi:tetratricopeptide (TPR) repeat protein
VVDVEALRQIESLASLSRFQLARIRGRLAWHRYAPGDVVLPHQIRLDLDGVVFRGKIQVATVQAGRRRVVDHISTGESINSGSWGHYSLPIELRAVETTIVCLLPTGSSQTAVLPHLYRRLSRRIHPRRWFTTLSAGLTAAQAVLFLMVVLFGLVAWHWQSPWRTLLSNLAYGRASQRLEANDELGALCLLQTSLALNPRSARSYNDLGYIHYRQGKPVEAQAAFHEATSVDPTLAVAQNNLGLSYLEAGQVNLARDALRKAVALNPESAVAWTNLAVAEQRAGHPEEAINAYQAALRLDPQNTVAQVNLGVVYYQQGFLVEAESFLEQALSSQPEQHRLRVLLGAIALSRNDYERAWNELQRAAPNLENDPLLHFYLALWYEAVDIRGAAEQELERVLTLNPPPELAELAQSHLIVIRSDDVSSTVETEMKGE